MGGKNVFRRVLFIKLMKSIANIGAQKNQYGESLNKPSMKWVYRLFHGIHVLKLNLNNQMQHIVLNLNELLRRIVIYFGELACNIYGVTIGEACGT